MFHLDRLARAQVSALIAAAALFASLAEPAAAQIRGDRQLLSTQGGNPYVMIQLDTSGSMNWATQCTSQDRALGRCEHDCSSPNCPQPRNGDDPNSKIYQAKEALYTVMTDPRTENIQWGFASLNQDQLVASAKHWLYEVESIALESGSSSPTFPAVGWQEVFGPRSGGAGVTAFDIGCDRKNPGAPDNGSTLLYEAGCYMNTTDAVATNDTDIWTLNKLKRLPKGGALGADPTVYFLRDPGNNPAYYYRVTYSGVEGGSYGDETLTVSVTIQSCTKNNVIGETTCGAANDQWSTVSDRTVTYAKIGPFFFWEGTPSRDVAGNDAYSKDAYFGGRTDGVPVSLDGVAWANTLYADKTCRGWEPSDDYPGQSSFISDIDPYTGTDYNTKFPTTFQTFDDPSLAAEDEWLFQFGDFIPLRWEEAGDPTTNNREAIMKRLNPKHPVVDDESFGEAVYFRNLPETGENFVRLTVDDDPNTEAIDEGVRPLIAHGSTPLAGWFSMFRRWYSGCGVPGKCTDAEGTGWQDIAAQFDTNFNCRKKYALLITDGTETCDGKTRPPENPESYYGDNLTEFPDGFGNNPDQCSYRASMQAQEDVETIVIGFGTEFKQDLQCSIGNKNVFFAENKADLLELLTAIIGEILEEAAAFASAAVPTVQANILDKIYLSSFVPLEGESVWPGRLDAFLKPLPLDDTTGLPNRDLECLVGQQSECFAWDAGDSQPGWDSDGPPSYDPQGLLKQAPLQSQIVRDLANPGATNSLLQIGTGVDERRVFFGRPDDPDDVGSRRYFRYPVDNDAWLDLAFVWNVPIADAAAVSDAEKTTMADVIDFTLAEKQALITDPDTGAETRIQYVMGDIFHSNPVVVNPPNDFDLFTKDLYWNSPLCGQNLATTRARGEQISYSWFSNKNICRRVMVAVGSNDGQMHVFDGGIIRDITPDDPTEDGDQSVPADCLLNVPSNSSSRQADLFDDDGLAGGYDFGSGRELFSFIPQAMMPLVRELSEISELTTEYGIDGTTRIADVFVDPVLEAGVPTCTQRTWRTLLMGSYREGGPGIFALDITQPDSFDTNNQPQPLSAFPEYVPSCTDGDAGGACADFCIAGDASCASLPFPALRWEFRDLDDLGAPADLDGDGNTDLAESWSRPLVFRHPVCTGECDTPIGTDPPADLEDRWIAVFGGGLSEMPTNSDVESGGNWLYMIDVETGEILYKRGGTGLLTSSPIVGAVPADIAGVDFDTDGIVDTLYFGTTAGYVYKVALGDEPFELGDDATEPATLGRIVDPDDDAGKYDPFVVFDTDGRSIYLEINAVYVPKMRANALLFGTGIRWDLWNDTDVEGRFYALVDQDWRDANRDGTVDPPCVTCVVPMVESQYQSIDPDDLATPTANFLYGVVSGKLPGWYFTLEPDEKLITEPFTLSGVSFFTVFAPLEVENRDGSCSLGGESKIFVVNAVTTEGYAIQAGSNGERTRYITAPTFTTQPFVEPSATKNEPTSSSTSNADSWTVELAEINADLRKLFPAGARFANYTLDIKTIRKDTGIVFIAPVPVAIEPHNWKEF